MFTASDAPISSFQLTAVGGREVNGRREGDKEGQEKKKVGAEREKW